MITRDCMIKTCGLREFIINSSPANSTFSSVMPKTKGWGWAHKSPCIVIGCCICTTVRLFYFPSCPLCLESARTVNLRGKKGYVIALVLGGSNGLPLSFFQNFSLLEASGFSCLFVWTMFSDPSLLYPEPHSIQGGFSSWWYWRFKPKANKELAVCL